MNPVDSTDRSPRTRNTALQPLNLYYANCNSFRNKLLQLKQAAAKSDADIVVLNETWLTDSDLEVALLDDYIIYRRYRDGHGGGVMIAIRKYLKSFSNTSIVSTFEIVAATILVKKKRLTVLTFYRPPSMAQDWLTELDRWLTELTPNCDELLFVGDLNVNLLRRSIAKNNLEEIFSKNGLFQIVRQATRQDNLLDVLFYTSFENISAQVAEKMAETCDHSSIRCQIDVNFKSQPPSRRTKSMKYDFENTDWTNVRDQIEQIKWEEIDDIQSADEYLTQWTSRIKDVIKSTVPKIAVKVTAEDPLLYRLRRKLKAENEGLRDYRTIERVARKKLIESQISTRVGEIEDSKIRQKIIRHENIYSLYQDIKRSKTSQPQSCMKGLQDNILTK